MATEFHFHEFTGILRRRKRLILSMSLVGTVLAGMGALMLPSRYTAKAQIVFDPHYATPSAGQTPPVSSTAEDALIATQATTLLSGNQMDRVRIGLPNDPDYNAAVATRAARKAEAKAEVREMFASAWKTVESWLPPRLRSDGADAASVDKAAPRPQDAAADASLPTPEDFQRHLRAFQEAGSHVIAVVYTADSPEVAASVANSTIRTFIETGSEQARAAISRELAWLNDRIPALKAELDRIESETLAYQAARNIVDISPGAALDQYAAELTRQLATAENDLAARQARLAYMQELRSGRPEPVALLDTLSSPALASLYQQQGIQLQMQSELTVVFGSQYPKLRQVESKLGELRSKIQQEADRALRTFENEAKIAAASTTMLQSRLDGLRRADSDARLRDLKHDAATKRQLYGSLMERQEQLSGQQNVARADVRLLSLASVPDRPSSPAAWMFLLPGMVVCLLGSCMIAVFADRLDMRMRSARDIREALNLPCLATVPLLRRIGRNRALLANPLGAYTEAIRSMVASLHLVAPETPPTVVLVTSSLPGEGKTTLAVSFAAYVASLGRRVLLVDLDFRNPSSQRELGRETGVGVLDVLNHERPACEAIQHLPDLHMDYLPVAGRPADPFALFASNQMRHLLDELRDSYDCVVVDGPPLLVITETRLLAAIVDKVVLAVKWGSTRRDTAQDALDLLSGPVARAVPRNAVVAGAVAHETMERDRIDVAGAVLTQVDTRHHGRTQYGKTSVTPRGYRRKYIQAA